MKLPLNQIVPTPANAEIVTDQPSLLDDELIQGDEAPQLSTTSESILDEPLLMESEASSNRTEHITEPPPLPSKKEKENVVLPLGDIMVSLDCIKPSKCFISYCVKCHITQIN